MRLRLLLPVLSVAVLVAAGRASAEPHTRTGPYLGFGFGLESVSWKSEDGERDVEASGTLTARAGWALKPTLLVGAEFWGWANEYEVQTSSGAIPINVRLTSTTAAVTVIPGNAGFFLRLGAGLAYGDVESSPPSGVSGSVAPPDSDTGFAFIFAPGYEWRLTARFALGFQGDIVYLGLNDVLQDAFGYGLNAQFNWYW